MQKCKKRNKNTSKQVEQDHKESNSTTEQVELSLEEARAIGLFNATPKETLDYEISRTIFFDQEISEQSATELRAQLMTLAGEDRRTPIRLMLGSPGGDLYSSLAIYDTIKMIPNHITAICSGKVMSGGIIVLLACDSRLSTPNTTFMIHHGSTSIQGNILELEEQFKKAKLLNNKMLNIISNITKIPKQPLKNKLLQDYYMNTEEAIEMGLVERSITTLDQINS